MVEYTAAYNHATVTFGVGLSQVFTTCRVSSEMALTIDTSNDLESCCGWGRTGRCRCMDKAHDIVKQSYNCLYNSGRYAIYGILLHTCMFEKGCHAIRLSLFRLFVGKSFAVPKTASYLVAAVLPEHVSNRTDQASRISKLNLKVLRASCKLNGHLVWRACNQPPGLSLLH